MNILGHENADGSHLGQEEATVETSTEPGGSTKARAIAPTDSEIVAAAQRRDRDSAAELLVSAHAGALGRTCMALLGSQTDAEDALQETLEDALQGLESFRGEGSLRAWLLSIARRRCARRLTARGKQRDLEQSLAEPEAPVNAEHLALARRARSLLAEVRPTEREALVLRFGAELSFREVAEACGIDEAAARKRVSRGLSRLRELLGEGES